MFDQIKKFIGDLWGKTSTVALSVGLFVVAISADPAVQPIFDLWPGLRRVVAIVGAAVAILRFIAPPPAAVTITPEDAVSVMNENTVVITKPQALPANVVDQDPGKAA